MKRLILFATLLLSLTISAETRMMTVTGKGEITLVPDVTRLIVEVRSPYSTYEEAYLAAEGNQNRLAEVMNGCGLERTLAKTTYFNIARKTRAQYDEHHNYIGDEMIGYELQQNLKVDLGMDSKVLAHVVHGIGTAMANAEISINYLTSDPNQARLEMLERAVKDATAKAERMASAAGCKLGKVQSIQYHEQVMRPYIESRKFACMSDAVMTTAASLDLTPDDIRQSEEVTLVWELK